MNIARLGTLRQYEILLAVYESESVSAAAASLHLSQPTLSMQLKKLSEQAGVRLYDQIGKKLVFTEAGEVLVETARRVMAEFVAMQQRLEQLNGLISGTLRLSVVTSAKYFIPHLLGPFSKQFPDIDFQLKIGNRAQVIEGLNEAHDDFYVFSQLPKVESISAIDLLPNPLIAIAAADHPLAFQKRITLSELQHHKFIMRERGSGTRQVIENYLAERNMALPISMTIESNEAIKHCVMENLGVSILSEYTLAFGGDTGVVRLDVEGFPIPSQWYFTWPSDKQLSPIAEAFLQYVQREGRELLHQL